MATVLILRILQFVLKFVFTDGQAQNVLNLEDERKQEEEKVLREIEETEEHYTMWDGKFEKTNDAVTLVKGYFQQWIPTPDNFRSLLSVISSNS